MAHDLLLGQTRRDWGIGSDPLVWTPTAARAELDRVRGVLDTVNDEVAAASSAGKVSPAEWRSWERTYRAGHEVTGASSLWGSNVVAARQHEQQALKWHDLLKSRSSTLVGPPDLGLRPEPPLRLGLNLTTAALAVGGMIGLGYLVKQITGIVPHSRPASP